MKKFLHVLIIFTAGLLVGAAVTVNTLGLMLGNIIYKELSDPRLNVNLTGVVNHSQELQRIKELEADYPNAQKVNLYAPYTDGDSRLTGTYISGGSNLKKTVIIVHGLYQNRSMSINYIDVYRKLGFNVLLIDLRGHGESDGVITWGQTEIKDIDLWCDYLRTKQQQEVIGIHGISLGGAFSLLHSGLSEHPADFYVEDSSYSDIKSLYYNHLHNMVQLPDSSGILDVLWAYSQVCMYWHTGATLDKLSPLEAVKQTKSPVLFLHNDTDALIPVSAAEELYAACASPHKEMHIFRNSAHAQAISDYPAEYDQAVRDFLQQNGIVPQ